MEAIILIELGIHIIQTLRIDVNFL